ncbi:MAG: alpha/beta hydrolase, partial [Clostridia bacterium]|nr:alpha/beta hydrolase [Clostridia bacterium]
MKYPIKREFFPFTHFASPISSPSLAGWLGERMRPPRRIFRDPRVNVSRHFVFGSDGAEIELLLFSPKSLVTPSPCLVYYHGGGFFFGAAWYHYDLAIRYALEAGCKVAFVQYRLAPRHPHPIPCEDSFSALRRIYENADALGIRRDCVGVAGDSAGGALAAAVCQMSRDRGTPLPLFQLLVYPVTDRRMNTPSCRAFSDTPMWNSRLSEKMWQGYLGSGDVPMLSYASPMEAADFSGLPAAYVETAEFDCLRDEGRNY